MHAVDRLGFERSQKAPIRCVTAPMYRLYRVCAVLRSAVDSVPKGRLRRWRGFDIHHSALVQLRKRMSNPELHKIIDPRPFDSNLGKGAI